MNHDHEDHYRGGHTPQVPKTRRDRLFANLEPHEVKLVQENLELVDRIVRGMLRRLPSHIDKADLIQQGRIGLMEAARRYDPTSAASFKTFASYRIRGEIIDGMRAFSQGRPGEGAWNESVEAIAERSGGDDSIGGFVSSVQALGMAFNLATASSENPMEENLEKQTLWQAVKRLPERERHVCELLYRMDMTMQDIADVIGTSKASVSRLHKRALQRLRQDPLLGEDDMLTA